MGHKRKASALDETPSSQPPSSPPSLTSTSTTSSPSSMCTEPYHTADSFSFSAHNSSTFQAQPQTTWPTLNSSPSSWLQRTRKRVRNRPTEVKIHAETIKKLYEGQQYLNDLDPANTILGIAGTTIDADPDADATMDLGGSLTWTNPNEYMDLNLDGCADIVSLPLTLTLEPEAKQRSIRDFFSSERETEKERPRTAPEQTGFADGTPRITYDPPQHCGEQGAEMMEFENASATTLVDPYEMVEQGQQRMDAFLFGRS